MNKDLKRLFILEKEYGDSSHLISIYINLLNYWQSDCPPPLRRNQLMLESLPLFVYTIWGLIFQGGVGSLKIISLPPHIQRFLNLADCLKDL